MGNGKGASCKKYVDMMWYLDWMRYLFDICIRLSAGYVLFWDNGCVNWRLWVLWRNKITSRSVSKRPIATKWHRRLRPCQSPWMEDGYGVGATSKGENGRVCSAMSVSAPIGVRWGKFSNETRPSRLRCCRKICVYEGCRQIRIF